MRFVVLSDTHRELSRMFSAVDYIKALDPDAVIFLGDNVTDAAALKTELHVPFHVVQGNCDGYSAHPATDVIEAEGVRIFICHGHQYDVKESPQRLMWAAQEKNCTVALFGHTHKPYLDREEGVLLMNPGSLTRPRLCEAGLAVLDVKNGQAKGLLLPFKSSAQINSMFF